MYRLLLVDDEPPIAEGLAEVIELAGLPLKEIKFFFSARKALEEFQKEPFDLIIADIRMPEMTGLEFIEQAKQQYPLVKVIFLTGFSDFQYARRALQLGAANYLLKPADDEELLDNVREAIQQLDQHYESMLALEGARKQAKEALPVMQAELFRQMLQEGELTSNWRREKFAQHDIALDPEKGVQTLIVRVDDYGRKFDRGDLLLIQFAVQNMVQELLDYKYSFFPFSYEEQSFVYLIQSEPAEPDDGQSAKLFMKERLSSAQQTLERVLGVSLSIAIGPDPVPWEQWAATFRFLQSSLRLNQNANVLVVPYEGMESRSVQYGPLNELLSEVTAALQTRSEPRFLACLDRAFGGKESAKLVSPEESVLGYLGITHAITNLLVLYNLIASLDSITLEKLSHFSSHRDMYERKQFLLQLFHLITRQMNRIRENPSEILIEQVKRYIEEHMGEDLSLNVLAKLKFVSPSYLSRLFHQLTGEQLTAYITRVRITEAKQLLVDPRYRIQDIADKLGYQSANYFSKVFRKAVGISPQDYRTSSLSSM
ncbi:response regulator [Paenibacillus sp. GCM10023252]|uniref:response regulator n=1 Tax=Paenibacillus sp. GCM10023252 TaxID=3252649 RepID=UPI00361AE7AE